MPTILFFQDASVRFYVDDRNPYSRTSAPTELSLPVVLLLDLFTNTILSSIENQSIVTCQTQIQSPRFQATLLMLDSNFYFQIDNNNNTIMIIKDLSLYLIVLLSTQLVVVESRLQILQPSLSSASTTQQYSLDLGLQCIFLFNHWGNFTTRLVKPDTQAQAIHITYTLSKSKNKAGKQTVGQLVSSQELTSWVLTFNRFVVPKYTNNIRLYNS